MDQLEKEKEIFDNLHSMFTPYVGKEKAMRLARDVVNNPLRFLHIARNVLEGKEAVSLVSLMLKVERENRTREE